MFTAESAESAEMTERENLNRIRKSIIGAAIEVHRAWGLASWSRRMKPVRLLNGPNAA